jgi:hypothetical protein
MRFNYIRIFFKNGIYIPFLHIFIYSLTKNLYLSTIISLKLFPTKFFFWFEEKNVYANNNYIKYRQLRQFVRFTDTGHTASLIYYFYPKFLPIAFNIHLMITIGYWYGKLILKVNDIDKIRDNEYIVFYNNIWADLNHGLILIFLTKDIYNLDYCFSSYDLYYTFTWLYFWAFFIYIPWRLITNDPVYIVFNNEQPLTTKIKYFFIANFIALISNYIGSLLVTCTSN